MLRDVHARADAHVVHVDVAGLDGVEAPEGRVAERNTGNLNPRHVVQLDLLTQNSGKMFRGGYFS